MKRELIFYPDLRLKKIAEPIYHEFGTDWLDELVQDMVHVIETNEVKGVGLAAIQIGVNKSVIIYKSRTGIVHALCNARIASRFGRIKSYSEGCLSVSGFKADIKRAKGVKVKAQTMDGTHVVIKERGLQSIILQHEIDHLNGLEFIDHIPSSNKAKQEYIKYLTTYQGARPSA